MIQAELSQLDPDSNSPRPDPAFQLANWSVAAEATYDIFLSETEKGLLRKGFALAEKLGGIGFEKAGNGPIGFSKSVFEVEKKQPGFIAAFEKYIRHTRLLLNAGKDLGIPANEYENKHNLPG